jgi:hypothetical protein
VLTTPALGTPASGVLTNCTGVAKAALPAGSVLQVVSAIYSSQTTNSTNTYTDTGLTATITPTSATSTILVLFSQNAVGKQTNATGVGVRLLRGATVILYPGTIVAYTSTTADNRGQSVGCCYLDSPATTSATTYKTQFNSFNNNAIAIVQDASASSTITLMEIAV